MYCPSALQPGAGASEFFVAPDGADTNPGTAEQPFATLGKAQEAVRQLVAASLKADVTVWLKEGTYTLDKPLDCGPDIGGTEAFSVTFASHPGETVVLSGGRRITGWKLGDGEIWTARLPKLDDGSWIFRNLYVNGRRAVRARTTNFDAEPNCVQLTGVDYVEDGSRLVLSLPPGLLGDWRSPADVEVMVAGNWAINRKRVQSIDAANNTVVLAPPHRHGPDYIFPKAGRWCYLENARELLDQPGEWHLDRQAGVLSYWPRPGEDLATADVIAPVATQLVLVQGTPERPVRNLHFKGLRLEYTDWQLPDDGYMGIQACHYGHSDQPGRRWKHIPAAVVMTDAPWV